MSLYELVNRPVLASPYLVMAMDGWIDAGLAGGTAVGAIVEQAGLEPVATFDTDALLDHRARRPTMNLVDGVNQSLNWPSIEVQLGRDADGTEALFLFGSEPDHQWRAFTTAVLDLVTDLGVAMVVGLGAYPAPAPHTRPIGVVATASTQDLADQVGFIPGHIQVPAGIHAAIERGCADRGVPAVGLWAQVPHYAAGMPYPGGAVALLHKLHALTGLRFDVGNLPEDAQRTRARLDELIDGNPDHLAMIAQLEAHHDSLASADDLTEIEPDELVAEVERFLRDQ